MNKEESSQNEAKKSREHAADRVERASERAAKRLEDAGKNAAARMRSAGAGIESNSEKVGEHLEDSALTAKVKSALIAEPGISAMSIDVETRKKVVTLYGTVDSETHKQRAMIVASAVDGVRAVEIELVIKK